MDQVSWAEPQATMERRTKRHRTRDIVVYLLVCLLAFDECLLKKKRKRKKKRKKEKKKKEK